MCRSSVEASLARSPSGGLPVSREDRWEVPSPCGASPNEELVSDLPGEDEEAWDSEEGSEADGSVEEGTATEDSCARRWDLEESDKIHIAQVSAGILFKVIEN